MSHITAVYFQRHLLQWHEDHPRDMPWKNTSDPYHIWISEIILQQTRVKQGWDYYIRFIKRFPSIQSLASADVDDVLHAWEGLGYYTRARNIHKAASIILSQHAGIFPSTYEEILALPGIGPYTAAAISSFAFQLPHPVIDGNVVRVLSRLFGIEENKPTARAIVDVAHKYMLRTTPDSYNQAIMNFGALTCKPSNPDCNVCPFSKKCIAALEDRVHLLPPPKKAIKKKSRTFHYFVITDGDSYVLEPRVENDVWALLYQFPMIESRSSRRPALRNIHQLLKPMGLICDSSLSKSKAYQQTLSHQEITAYFYPIRLVRSTNLPNKSLKLVKTKSLEKFAFPKIINRYIADKLLHP